MKRTREDDTAKTKSRIIQAAEIIISERGYENLTVTAVAKSLSMSPANIYRHVSSKGDLVAAVAARWMREMRDACEYAITIDESSVARLVALIIAIRKQLALRSGNPEALKIYEFVRTYRPNDARAHHSHRRALFEEVLQDRSSQAPVFEDALRYFTDPQTFLESQTENVLGRIEAIIVLLLNTNNN